MVSSAINIFFLFFRMPMCLSLIGIPTRDNGLLGQKSKKYLLELNRALAFIFLTAYHSFLSND